ncbi:bone morphogenetic protein 7-like [Panonychus citri]|uniref:bone morphogenetic protein 7-like n=1 Tax=Panonychus citri TaxID=50023 RepID=UPI0023082FF4|nr:bone morphogenetic protein 7-like [Panonychus citri]
MLSSINKLISCHFYGSLLSLLLINQLNLYQCYINLPNQQATNSQPSTPITTYETQSTSSIENENNNLKPLNGTSANHDNTNKLLKIIGIGDHVERRTRHLSAPQFMIDLYKTLADPLTGSIRRSKPYQASTVWAFQHSDLHQNHLHFHFNVTTDKLIGKQILEAEFHLFKLKPRHKLTNKLVSKKFKTQLLEVGIYQLLSSNINGDKLLLDSRRMSLNSIGWEMFYVKKALINWIKDNSTNFGLLITVKSLSGEDMNDHLIRWFNGHHHQINKRPILVVYTSEKGHKSVVPKNNTNQDFSAKIFSKLFLKYGQPSESESSENSDDEEQNMQHHQHHSLNDESDLINLDLPIFNRLSCSRVGYTIDLDKLGWTRFIIYPKSLGLYRCEGGCDHLIDSISSSAINGYTELGLTTTKLSKHAAIQSYINQQQQSFGVNPVSCVPTELESLDILYFATDGTVILQQIDDIVASQCGCQ